MSNGTVINLGTAGGGGQVVSSGSAITITNEGVSIRWTIRDGRAVKDITLTATGFAGTKNVDWENLEGEIV